jgi:ABC-2 type transport system permease protein
MHAFRALARSESRLFLRDLPASVSTLALPVLLVAAFGLIPGFGDASPDLGGQSGTQFIAAISVGITIALLGFSVLPGGLATNREKGILRRLAATPVNPTRMLAAQVTICAGALAFSLLLVLGVARIGYGVPLPAEPVRFALAVLLGAAAMFSLGLLIGALAPTARSGTALGMGLFFPSMFLAGVYVPREALPPVVQHLSDFTPLGACVEALRDTWAGHGVRPLHLAIMAGYAVAACLVALRVFRWQ